MAGKEGKICFYLFHTQPHETSGNLFRHQLHLREEKILSKELFSCKSSNYSCACGCLLLLLYSTLSVKFLKHERQRKKHHREIKHGRDIPSYLLTKGKHQKGEEGEKWKPPYLQSLSYCVILGSNCADRRHRTAACGEFPPAADMWLSPLTLACQVNRWPAAKIAAARHVCGR